MNAGNTVTVDIADVVGGADTATDMTQALLAAIDAAPPGGVTRMGKTLTFDGTFVGGTCPSGRPTRAAAFRDNERATGPLMFQGDHGAVAFREIRLRAVADAESLARDFPREVLDDSGFVAIFDGKTLDGWHVSARTGHSRASGNKSGGRWVVEGGAIVGSQDIPGNGGIVVTDRQYGDFEVKQLHVAFDVDSGVATATLYYSDVEISLDETKTTPVLLQKRDNPESNKDTIKLSETAFEDAKACLPPPDAE